MSYWVNSIKSKQSKLGSSIKSYNTLSQNQVVPVRATLVALCVAQSIGMHAQAATIHVGGPTGRGCGLSAAILSANNDISHPGSNCAAGSGDDVIELNRDVVVRKGFNRTLTGMPVIESAIVINGNGHTIRRDDNAPAVRILKVDTDQNVSLNDLTISGGLLEFSASGAGIFVSRVNDLSLVNTVVSNNHLNSSRFSNSRGGGIRIAKFGSANISNSLIVDNTSGDEGGGIGFYSYEYSTNSSIITISDSEISNNSSARAGGGIFLDSAGRSLTVSNSVISNNTSGDGGGLSLNFSGSITIENSEISDNSATDGRGGGIYLEPLVRSGYYFDYFTAGKMTITNSTLQNNIASGNGGFLATQRETPRNNTFSPVFIESSTISGNSAGGSGGAFNVNGDVSINNSNIFDNEAGEDGGGILSGGLSLSNTSVWSNKAGRSGGAIAVVQGESGNGYQALLNVTNSTISANTAVQNGGGISVGQPMPYYSDSHIFSIANSTIANNSANNGGGADFGLGEINIANTLITGNISSTAQEVSRDSAAVTEVNTQNNLFGTSLISNFQAFANFTPGGTDITATIDGTTPTLLEDIVDELQSNGGPTSTHALAINSPAKAMADSTICFDAPVNKVDQRGEERLNGSPCDIGAYESESSITLPGFSVEDVFVIEKSGSARVVITLDEPQPTPVSVRFRTVNGSAEAGLDYVERSGRITFRAGETRKYRTIEIVDDSQVVENDESFTFELSSPNGGFLQRGSGTINIVDPENATSLPFIRVTARASRERGFPAFSKISRFRERPNVFAVFTFSIFPPVPFPVSVDYSAVPGDGFSGVEPATPGLDFVERSGSITFAPGQTEKIRYVQIIEDGVSETDEAVTIELSNPVNALISSRGLDTVRSRDEVTIVDSDSPFVTLAVDKTSVNEAGGSVKVDLRLSEPRDYEVKVWLRTFDGSATTPFFGESDYEAFSEVITFLPGETVQSRTIDIIQDDEAERDEDFLIYVTIAENAEVDSDVGNQVTVTILDDD